MNSIMIPVRFLYAGNRAQCVIMCLIAFVLDRLTVHCDESVFTVALTVVPAVELKRLRSDLLSNYDRLIRPAKNQSQITEVRVYFDVQHIVSLDEKLEILSVKGKLMMKWVDEHLHWDPYSYSGISAVRFLPKEVWIPEVRPLYNTRNQDIYEKDHRTPVTVYNNGTVKWYPQTVFDVPCSAQYRHYPFDSHNCSILFLAWNNRMDAVKLQKMQLPSGDKTSIQGSEWLLTRFEYENVKLFDTQYDSVQMQLFLERTSGIYRYICVIPTLISMVSLLFGFWLLPNETPRYMIGCSNIIVLSMLLQYLAATVPAGREVPLLAQYCASCLCMSAVFVVLTMIANCLRECSWVPSNELVRLAHVAFDRYLCLFAFSHISGDNSRDVIFGDPAASITSSDELKRRKDCYSVAMFVDRIAFWCFAIIFVILLAVLAAV